jgi:hypothetical protein
LLWLRGQAAPTGRGSVSEVLDRLVGEARSTGRTDPAAGTSVPRSIDLPDDDPALTGADAYIRSLFTASARQPLVGREKIVRHRSRARRG